MALSFVNYNVGEENQSAESRRIVKAHVTRAWHREKRVAETIKYARSQQSLKSVPVMRDEQGFKLLRGGTVTQPSPTVALPYLGGLIPYSYFASGGPVLYLKPSKWPFHRPFMMAGASSAETFGRSVFPRQSIWMPDADIPDKVSMKGPLLGGDVLSWISHTPECFKYRGNIIGWIQQQLNSPTASTSNATIGAIMTLTMWENGDGSSLDLSIHMDGLENIVKLKGGTPTLQEQGMSTKLIMFDYIIAISCATQPRFKSTSPPQPHSPASELSRNGIFAGSPLHGSGDFSQVECNWRCEDTRYTLEVMWGLTEQALEPTTTTTSQEGVRNRPRTLISASDFGKMPKMMSIRQTFSQQAEEIHIFETLHHTAMIYQRAVAPPHVPFNSPINYRDLSRLYESLNISAPSLFWIQYPGILLWVLLVGCAVSVKREERSYFMMFLAKVGIFTEHKWWFETQSAVLRFIEVQGLARTP